ncbi:dihydroflavonol-4-reductase [Deltaproteobacteria bacterium]|nr:dihydroflavonol-4-reductase [Deltaproteobacteria bacterium]
MRDDVLVLGANGFLGLHVVDALRAEGVEPRCGRRRRSNVLGLLSRRANRVLADLDEPESLRGAMSGVNTVIHLAGHYPRHSLDPVGTLSLGVQQTRTVLDAAREAGVRRIVYVSSTATVSPSEVGASTEADRFDTPPNFGLYHRLKWAMEGVFAEAGDIEVRVALPAGCIGPGDLRVGTSAMLVALARGDDPPHPDGTVSLVDPRDAAVGIARQALRADAPSRLILSGRSVGLHPLLVEAAALLDVAPPSPPLSAETMLARARAAESAAAGKRSALSQEIVELAVYGVPVDGSLATRALGVRYRSFADSLTDFVRWATPLGFLTPQTEPTP